eukprot:750429-Hanusia_phi.AAC.5
MQCCVPMNGIQRRIDVYPAGSHSFGKGLNVPLPQLMQRCPSLFLHFLRDCMLVLSLTLLNSTQQLSNSATHKPSPTLSALEGAGRKEDTSTSGCMKLRRRRMLSRSPSSPPPLLLFASLAVVAAITLRQALTYQVTPHPHPSFPTRTAEIVGWVIAVVLWGGVRRIFCHAVGAPGSRRQVPGMSEKEKATTRRRSNH